jgi:hypothetical protein
LIPLGFNIAGTKSFTSSAVVICHAGVSLLPLDQAKDAD